MASRPPFGSAGFGRPGQPLGAGTRGIAKYQPMLQAAAAREGVSLTEFNAFMAYWSENQLKFAEKILAFKDAPENAIEILKMFAFFRKLGLTAQQMTPAFVLIASLRSPLALNVMHHVATKGPAIASKLKPLGGPLKALGIFIAAVETYNALAKGEWGDAIAKIYQTVMGLAVPWGGAIDGLQSLLPEVGPRTATMLKVVRACDPVGLGGGGVQAMVWFVQAAADKLQGKPFDEDRLNKLANKLKTGPTSFFYEIGEKLPIGDIIFDISQMSMADWKALGMKPLSELHEILRSWTN